MQGRLAILVRRGLAILAVAGALVLLATAWKAGFFDSDPYELSGAVGRRVPLAALYFSGDMGLRFGAGPHTAAALRARGLPVLGVSSSTAFRAHRDRAFVDRFVADSVRAALARTGAARIVVIGQSYGADILQTGLARVPDALRSRIAAIVLIVPGDKVFFRADPSNLSYQGAPDSIATATARTLSWAPLTCIYGTAEPDSLCPALTLANARLAPLPGGHFLEHDYVRLENRVMAGVDRANATRGG